MSFRSILLKIESVVSTVLGDVVKAEPIVNSLLPEIGFIPMFGPLAAQFIPVVFGAVNSMETLITGVEQGQAKQQSAVAIIQAQAPNLESVISIIGKGVGLTPAALNKIPGIVDGAVAIANAIAAFEAELQAQAAAKPPAPAAPVSAP